MRGARWLVLASCSIAMMFASSAVRAEGGGTVESGTISFIGAVGEPTCSIAADPVSLSAVITASGSRLSLPRNCLRQVGASPNAADASRIYQVDVEHLSVAEPDRVLNYFASYVRAAQTGTADPVLVTQNFE